MEPVIQLTASQLYRLRKLEKEIKHSHLMSQQERARVKKEIDQLCKEVKNAVRRILQNNTCQCY